MPFFCSKRVPKNILEPPAVPPMFIPFSLRVSSCRNASKGWIDMHARGDFHAPSLRGVSQLQQISGKTSGGFIILGAFQLLYVKKTHHECREFAGETHGFPIDLARGKKTEQPGGLGS